jgi:hypothetical protein
MLEELLTSMRQSSSMRINLVVCLLPLLRSLAVMNETYYLDLLLTKAVLEVKEGRGGQSFFVIAQDHH